MSFGQYTLCARVGCGWRSGVCVADIGWNGVKLPSSAVDPINCPQRFDCDVPLGETNIQLGVCRSC